MVRMSPLIVLFVLSSVAAAEVNITQRAQAIKQSLQGGETYQLIVIEDKVYYVSEQPYLTWFESARACNAMGMKLLSLETVEKNQLINDSLLALGIEFKWYWTSGQLIDGGWIWTSLGEIFSFTDWRSDEPDNSEADVGTGMEIANGWWDNDVTTVSAYICE